MKENGRFLRFLLFFMIFIVLNNFFLSTSSSFSEDFPFKTLILPLKEIKDGTITLRDWKFKEKGIIAGLEPVYEITDWGGKKIAAVVLFYNLGGSGVYKRLFILKKEKNIWKPLCHKDLGDRVKVRYLSLQDHGRIYLGLIEHKKNDPLCCPTKRILRVFEIRGKKLNPIHLSTLPIFPDEISFDEKIIGKRLIKNVVPRISFSSHVKKGKPPCPSHCLFFSKDKTIILRVIPLKEFLDMWLREGDLTVKIAVERFKRALKGDRIYLTAPVDILPPRPGLNDFSISFEKISFKNGTGVGFIGRLTKDILCVSKDELKYFYQGISDDQKYIIDLEVKLNVLKDFPDYLWDCNQTVKGLKKQIEILQRELPKYEKSGFSPSIKTIRAFIGSISIKEK